MSNNTRQSTVDDNNLMMEANLRDPKLFSKLVSRNRKNNQGYTTMIQVDGKEHRGDAQVLSGFFNYHNGNYNPPQLTKLDESMQNVSNVFRLFGMKFIHNYTNIYKNNRLTNNMKTFIIIEITNHLT